MSQVAARRGLQWRRQLPNALSFLRILLIPVIISLSLQSEYGWAAAIFVLGALTDCADGWVARRYHCATRFGMILDPVADLLYILGLIPLLWYLDAIGPLFAVLVVTRCLIQLSVLPVMVWWLKRPFDVNIHWFQTLTSVVALTVLGLGFAKQLTFEWLPDLAGMRVVFDRTLSAITAIGCLLEVGVLIRFVPRYLQILRRKHRTFE